MKQFKIKRIEKLEEYGFTKEKFDDQEDVYYLNTGKTNLMYVYSTDKIIRVRHCTKKMAITIQRMYEDGVGEFIEISDDQISLLKKQEQLRKLKKEIEELERKITL